MSGLKFVWPKRLLDLQSGRGEYCACRVHNSTDGRNAFETCACLRDADIVPWVAENGSICLSDLNFALNEMVVNFQCITNECAEECFVRTLISLHRIIVAGMVYNCACIR